jgi:hypothetical protein
MRTEFPRVTEEQIAAFHDCGFLALDRVTTGDDVRRIQTLLDALYARFDQLPKGIAFDLGSDGVSTAPPQIPEINRAVQLEPGLKSTAAFANCREIARQLFGRTVHFSGDHAIYKPPRSTKSTLWHQDQAFLWHPWAERSVTFWLPLQDVTVEMGCMQFIPFSHRGGLRPHHRPDGNPTSHALTLDDVDPSTAVPCPIPAGGATLHSPLTVHATGPNQSDVPRRAWIIAFSAERPYSIVRAATKAAGLAHRLRMSVSRSRSG